MKHANISIFVPHIGCTKRCSFCNQNSITGHTDVPSGQTVADAVNTALSSPGYDPKLSEIGFFGGSFTAIDKEYRQSLLRAANNEVKKGNVGGIRISTRPDAVDKEITDELLSFGVTAVELGAQSMCDDVLRINRRGHSSEDVVNASKLIKDADIELGLQMMTGLMGDTDEKALYTAKRIAELNPATVRVYPTVTLKGTYLAKKYESGEYTPQSLEDAIGLCADIVYGFYQKKIEVIRLGLHSINTEDYIAGPFHPAFGELTEGEIYYKLSKKEFCKLPKGSYTVKVKRGEVSKFIGQRRRNVSRLSDLGYNIKVKEEVGINKYGFKIEREE